MSTLEQLNGTLKADLENHQINKFIQDLDAGFKDTSIKKEDLQKAAHDDLVAKQLIPDLKLDGEAGGKIDLEDAKGKHYSFTATDAHPDVAQISDSDGKQYQMNDDKTALVEAKAAQPKIVGNTPDERYITRDDSGRITNADGVTMTYGADGTLQSLTWKSGQNTETAKVVNGAWVDESGKPYVIPPTLDQRTGDLTFQNGPANGKDSPITVWRADNSVINLDPKTKLPTELAYQNGDTRDFKYDQNNKLAEVDYTPKNGTADKWKLEDGKWNNYDSDDKATQKPPLKDISVDKNGSYTETNADGTKRVFASDMSESGNDKTERDVLIDGGKIHWKDGQIQSITTKTNETRSFTYDDSGALTRVDYDNHNGTKDSWRKENGEWVNYGSDDKPVANKDHLKDIGITTNGDYYETTSDDKRRTFHPDGTDATGPVPPPDTTSTTTTDNGKVDPPTPPQVDESKMTLHQKWVLHHKSEKQAIDADVQANNSHTIVFGDTMWDIAKSSLKKNDGKDKPTYQEINAEIERLAKKNGIDDPGKPPMGKPIDTSPDQPATPTGTGDANAVKGDKGQVVHFDGTDHTADHITEIDYPKSQGYPNGMKVTFVRDTDGSIKEMDIAGGGPEDGQIVKDGDHFKRTKSDNTVATVDDIDVDPDGTVTIDKVKGQTGDPMDQTFAPDGTITSEISTNN